MITNVLLSKVKNQLILGWAFVRMLTIQKILNLILLRLSFWLSQGLGQVLLWGKATTLSIEPTTSCNLRCPECPSGLRAFSRPTGMLQEKLYQEIINQSKNHLTWLHLYFQGEPFLNPKFLDLVRYADQRNVFTSTSTNAHYLNQKTNQQILDSGLKQLIISMDGISQASYKKYRVGGQLEKVKTGLSELLKLRKEQGSVFPRIILQFLVTGQNEQEIPELKHWAKEIGVDELQLKSIQIYDFENGSDLIPADLSYSRYVPDGKGKWKLKKKVENKCWRMWQGAVVTWDGKMVPCCFDKDANHVMGSFQTQSLSQIWKSSEYMLFRQQLITDRKEIEICKNCTE